VSAIGAAYLAGDVQFQLFAALQCSNVNARLYQ